MLRKRGRLINNGKKWRIRYARVLASTSYFEATVEWLLSSIIKELQIPTAVNAVLYRWLDDAFNAIHTLLGGKIGIRRNGAAAFLCVIAFAKGN